MKNNSKQIILGKAYTIDLNGGGMIPLENPGLPIGTVIYYEDRANLRKDYAITGDSAAHGFTGRDSQVALCEETGGESHIHSAAGKISGHWTITPRVLTSEELATWKANAAENKIRIVQEQETAANAAKIAADEDRARWAKEFAYLSTPGGKLSGHACGAKNIRKELALAFPGVKFSVTSKSYSGGSSISVSWDLGPTTREVEKMTNKYSQGNFNGMEDIYEYSRDQWNDIYGGAKYVSETRGEPEETAHLIGLLLCERWQITPPADGRSFWNCYLQDSNSHRDTIAGRAREILFAQSYPAGAVITGLDETVDEWGNKQLRAVFTLPDGTTATAGTPAARVAHLRAKWAEVSAGEFRGQIKELAARTGRPVLDVFERWEQFRVEMFNAGEVGNRPDATPEAFAALPEFAQVATTPAAAVVTPPAREPVPMVQPGGARMELNAAKNGVEIYFPSKPAAAVLERLKAAGWRWSRFAGARIRTEIPWKEWLHDEAAKLGISTRALDMRLRRDLHPYPVGVQRGKTGRITKIVLHQEKELQLGRLRGWLRTPEQAAEEMQDPQAAQYFNGNLQIGGNPLLLLK